jgi:autotransporter-associated beta strand protein
MKIHHKISQLAAYLAARRPESSRLAQFKLILALGGVIAAPAAFGQTIRTWNGGDGTGTLIGYASNWSGTLPVITGTGGGDIGQWSGVVPGDLALKYDGGLASGFGNSGVSFSMVPPQTGAVNISSPLASSPNLAILSISNDTANASFSLGNTSANILNLIWRPGNANQVHDFINNSASPSIIYPNVRVQSGGGVVHVLLFQGTGDWRVTNNLITANNAGTLIQKTGSGTLYWGGPSLPGALGNNGINSPITIAGGTVVLLHNTVLSFGGVGNSGSQNIVNNGTLFKYDAPSLAQTLTGVISGSGNLEVANGTLTLSGQNTYGGNTILSGGTLVLNRAETEGLNGPLGVGGTVSFTGGTLQYSVNNTFDYSPRFSTAASQAYRIDTGGQSVMLTNALTSSGGTFTKLGSGVLTLTGANTYDGLTTVSAGKLVIQGSAGAGNITVANSAALGVTAGTPITPATLTVGTSSSATLEFNNVSSTTTALLAAGTISAGGPITVNVNSGSFAVGQSYPLFSWSSGAAPAVTLGVLTGAGGNLTTNANSIRLNITSLAYVWRGNTDGSWDTTTANNWAVNGVAQLWANGNTALFDDSAPGETNVVLNAPISPLSVTVNSSAKTYSITSSGANLIGGSGGFTKSGNSTLTLAGGVNTYSGPTTVNGGALSVGALANGGAASDIGAASSAAGNLVLNGGTLNYTGAGGSSDRLFTLGTGNGSIASSGSGALTLNNAGAVALSGTGARTLTLGGSDANDNTLAATLADGGGATALTKNGSGKWVLTGNNTYSGATTIANGTLQVGVGGASGSLGSGNIINNGSLVFNTSSTLTNGSVSGTGTITKDGSGTVILPGDNSYAGSTTINAGTVQVGNGGPTGKLTATAPVVNDGNFIFNSTGLFSMNGGGVISGTGNVIVRGAGGLFKAIGPNTYTGWTLIDPGATFQPCEGNSGALASPVVTNNGTLKFVNQVDSTFTYAGSIVGSGLLLKEGNNVLPYSVPLTGTNTYTGGTFIAHGGLVLGDGFTPGAGAIVGDVIFTNSPVAETARTLTFNRPDDFTFPGLITYSATLPFGNRGVVAQVGGGTVTLTANNDYPGGTAVSNGVVQVGNGGTTGAIGTGPVTVESPGLLIFNRSDDITFGNTFIGSGNVVKAGAGKLTLTSTNNIFGNLIVSNGTLIVNSDNFASSTLVYTGTLGGTGVFYGPITLEAGTTLAPGASVGTMTCVSSLSIGGNLAIEVNKSLAQSNDVVVVSGALTKVGAGTLTVANIGPTLQVGDKFTLFSQPLTGGSAVTVTGGSATWVNNLEVDGSITVATVLAPPTLNFTPTGGGLQFSWTGSGYKLQAQTNSLSVGISNNWGDYPGGGASPVTVPVNVANGAVFFRLAPTP